MQRVCPNRQPVSVSHTGGFVQEIRNPLLSSPVQTWWRRQGGQTGEKERKTDRQTGEEERKTDRKGRKRERQKERERGRKEGRKERETHTQKKKKGRGTKEKKTTQTVQETKIKG